jgi:hypothetical protein
MATQRALATHRRRQGLIIALLLLGPAPVAVELFALGTDPGPLALVLAEVALLVGAMLTLYGRQRRLAPEAGLRVLPLGEVVAMLAILGCVGGATFLLPSPALAPAGFACLVVALAVIYGMAIRLRRVLEQPDERSAVLVLGLMAVLIALGGALV